MSECSPAIAVRVLDWDHEELDLVRAHGLKYTVRSSKYPRYDNLLLPMPIVATPAP